jgi:hypothetical protein
MAANHISVNGLTDTLILFAIGMVLARVIRFAHARRSTSGTASRRPAAPAPLASALHIV